MFRFDFEELGGKANPARVSEEPIGQRRGIRTPDPLLPKQILPFELNH